MAEGQAAQKVPLDELTANAKLINDHFKTLTDTVVTQEGKAHLAKVSEARAAYVIPRDKVRGLVKAGDKVGAAATLSAELHPAQLKYQAAIDEFITHEEMMMSASSDDVTSVITATTAR